MRTAILVACVLIVPFFCQAQDHPQWSPPLVDTGETLECPDHAGLRQYRSETAAYKGISVFISQESRRDSRGCHYTAELRVIRNGVSHQYSLPNAKNEAFSIMDFSPDSSRLLLASYYEDGRESRDVAVTTMPISSGVMDWQNAWDIFGWKNCDATVEPQGFAPDGKAVMMVRPSVADAHEQPSCVSRQTFYEVGLTSATPREMPESSKIRGYGAVAKGPWRTCRTDPDIVAACFIVRGRLSFWNGTPLARIWRIGTKRMIGVHDDVLPGSLDLNMDWDVEAVGDFFLCPFTREKPGAMQFVCIDSAKNVKYKKIR
ncbi:MAG TPA: hypothetical protein VNF02_00595 [Candidatus Limnocylindrales bacterium]|nr:hypothetical protein [Candidatus Limnocylindrales bacterium]